MLRLAALLPVAVLLSGCVTHGVPTPIHPYTKSFSVDGDREAVFDAALRASHGLNLNVAVLEKESGLIRFDSATLTAWRG
jgi:hypothetical protein